MNYAEEQSNELEAIEAIYPNELDVITSKFPAQFLITLKTEPLESDEFTKLEFDNYLVTLHFKFVPLYPDDAPLIEIKESLNLDECDENELLEMLQTNANESLGMVMVFTLVSDSIEWINRLAERKKHEKIEYFMMKKREEEEIEMKKFEGTRVTVESFMNWKFQFEAELKSKIKVVARDDSKRLTGKELFEKDRSLIESDLQFLDDAIDDDDLGFDETGVKVNESLFENLDDLDLDDIDEQ